MASHLPERLPVDPPFDHDLTAVRRNGAEVSAEARDRYVGRTPVE